jgi:glutaredoxin 3
MARVAVYTTSMCSYCVAAKRLLEERGVPYEEFDVSDDAALRNDVVQRSGRRTVPQIFIDGRSIGGFEELRGLDAAGDLESLREPASR